MEKVDSENGEQTLHDDAIFSIYVAGRYTSRYEIEKAGAPARRGRIIVGMMDLYTGTMAAGTFVCLEEEF